MIKCAYILAKDESKNIERSVKSLATIGICTIVLDSGSSDDTAVLAAEQGAQVVVFDYINHCRAYNELTSRHSAGEILLVFDADMCVNSDLISQVQEAFDADPELEAVIAPIKMYWEGMALKRSSLCPPKPIAFRGGRELFLPLGHGESLRTDVASTTIAASVVHDDRKDLDQVLHAQCRYARNLLRRSRDGKLNSRDRIRVRLPLFVFMTPLFSYIFKLGFLDGRAGLIYAIDRLIAEAIMFRTAISPLEKANLEAQEGAAEQ